MPYDESNIGGRNLSQVLSVFDQARYVLSNRRAYLEAASRLNRMTDHELADIGVNRSEIDEVIRQHL
ncbi:DUF1127 domain-containing protein [Ruegeria sp. 2205SS24-7]|uniref:DUF1127 domain-containing protein n=1 Tax=Ruegeria discodermiae TaxID=3064389 RepID=UPI0027425CEF|nr:DUF1127 domain-containing protein [Ruegeria sp. 2205SS24-7]MDP5220929.1 DUF1127 domain-containing protein [Ruegeria sp. 2205SS24-7]